MYVPFLAVDKNQSVFVQWDSSLLRKIKYFMTHENYFYLLLFAQNLGSFKVFTLLSSEERRDSYKYEGGKSVNSSSDLEALDGTRPINSKQK